MARLYISQERLDGLSGDNKVTVDGDILVMTGLGRSFRIRPAVRFLGVAGGDADPHELVGTVRDEEALVEMGADHMHTSVIYVETAYDVENGFLGDPLPRE